MKDAKIVKCYGAAHSNAYIDNCGVCLGHSWGLLNVCPNCGPDPETGREPYLKLARSSKRGQCATCRKWFLTPAKSTTL